MFEEQVVPQPLPIEETPEIPQPEADRPLAEMPPSKPKTSFGTIIGALILFVGLFGLGVWLSSFVRQFLPSGITPQETVNEPTVIPTPIDPMASWKTYKVMDISYKLPSDVLAPICDTTTCMSQGTYLPGGTRFTVAPRGTGQLLTDFRGSAISEVGGILFASKDTIAGGHNAKEFTGSFAGKTVAGYGFNKMRGYMIEVTPTTSLEINHFTPTGITADFTADDTLFDQIVGTLVLPATASARLDSTSSARQASAIQ